MNRYLELVVTFLFLSGNYVSDYSHCLYRLLREESWKEQGMMQNGEDENESNRRGRKSVRHRMNQLYRSTRRSGYRVLLTKIAYFIYFILCLIPPSSYMIYSNIYLQTYTNVERIVMNLTAFLSVLSEALFVYLDIHSSVEHLLEMIISLPNISIVRRLIGKAFILQMITLILLFTVRGYTLYFDLEHFDKIPLGQFIVKQLLIGLCIPFLFSCLYPIAFLFIVPECVRQHLSTFERDHKVTTLEGETPDENTTNVILVHTENSSVVHRKPIHDIQDIFKNPHIRDKIHEIKWLYSKLHLIKNSVVSIVYFTNFTAISFALSITEYLGQYVRKNDGIFPTMPFMKGFGLSVCVFLFLWPALHLRKCKKTIKTYQRNFIQGINMQNLMEEQYEGHETEFVQVISKASREQVGDITEYFEAMFSREEFSFGTKIPLMEFWPYASAIFIPILFQILHGDIYNKFIIL